VFEYGWVWGWTGTDGTPAPYFDNVSFCTVGYSSPALSSSEVNLAQDNFPAIGTIDYTDLGENSVRFDMARNISPPGLCVVSFSDTSQAKI